MSWSIAADGDAHCEIRWFQCLRPPTTSASSESPTFIAGVTRFLKLLRMLLILSIILVERYHRYVAIGKIESVTALDVIRQASLIIGQSTELAEAIVDAIWLHDVPHWFHLGLRFFPPFRYKSAPKLRPAHCHLAALVRLQAAGVMCSSAQKIELVPMRQALA